MVIKTSETMQSSLVSTSYPALLGQAERPDIRSQNSRAVARTHYERKIVMKEKRKRDKTLTIRLTESEKMMIEKKASKSKLNLTEYIISVSSKSKISVTEDTKPLLLELKRIGNNINQIAMKINSGVVSSYNFDEVISLQRKIYEQLLLLVGKN